MAGEKVQKLRGWWGSLKPTLDVRSELKAFVEEKVPKQLQDAPTLTDYFRDHPFEPERLEPYPLKGLEKNIPRTLPGFVRHPLQTLARELGWSVRFINDLKHDGTLVGEGGRTFPPGTSLADIPSVSPRAGRAAQTGIYVNGVNTTVERQAASFQELADVFGMNIIGVHNGSFNVVEDVLGVGGEKMWLKPRPATASLAKLLYPPLKDGERVEVIAHSGGGVSVSRAVEHLAQRLRQEGMSGPETLALLANLHVVTLGAASTEYPDGPAYDHCMNDLDLVPNQTGLGADLNPLLPPRPGAGAKLHRFATEPWEDPHGLETYLRHFRRE